MSEQGYRDTKQGFNHACPEHGFRRSGKRTRLPCIWVILKSTLRRLANKIAKRLHVTIAVNKIGTNGNSVGTCYVTNGIVKFFRHVYISFFEDRIVIDCLFQYQTIRLDLVEVGNIYYRCLHTRMHIFNVIY